MSSRHRLAIVLTNDFQYFITNDQSNVAGIVLAGSADFKNVLGQSDMFDPRLQAKVCEMQSCLSLRPSYSLYRS